MHNHILTPLTLAVFASFDVAAKAAVVSNGIQDTSHAAGNPDGAVGGCGAVRRHQVAADETA